MYSQESPIQKRVMRRVYVIYAARKLAQPRVLKLGALLGCFVVLASWTSLPHVWSNMPGNPVELLSFFTSAFAETEMLVQLASLLFFGFLVWLLPDLFEHRLEVA